MFEAVVSEEGTVRTISLQGECDLQVCPDVAELITQSLSDGFSAVRVDLRGLTFIDSSGLRAIVMANSQAESGGAKLSLIPGPPQVMRVFELVGLLRELPFERTELAG